ncbi:MAG: hypothetical protein JNG89_12985 [Planctomycetaceae bacterium]|nr:hypothetical protein [Planctomycetaceae bacterium]
MIDRPRGGRQLADLADLEDDTLAGNGVHERLSFVFPVLMGRDPGRGTIRDKMQGGQSHVMHRGAMRLFEDGPH